MGKGHFLSRMGRNFFLNEKNEFYVKNGKEVFFFQIGKEFDVARFIGSWQMRLIVISTAHFFGRCQLIRFFGVINGRFVVINCSLA